MSAPVKRKQSLYFPGAMLDEIRSEAHRLDHSRSWIVQRAWTLAREEMLASPPSTKAAQPNGESR